MPPLQGKGSRSEPIDVPAIYNSQEKKILTKVVPKQFNTKHDHTVPTKP